MPLFGWLPISTSASKTRTRRRRNGKSRIFGPRSDGVPDGRIPAKAGHDVTVYNRTFSKAEAWVDTYGGTARTPAEAAEGAAFVMACVGNDDDLRSVCLGETGAFATMPSGAIFVDHTTVSAAVT